MQTDLRTPRETVVDRPVIIVGTGRCGSTALHRVLADHPETAWLSRVCETWPRDPRANRWALQILDLPLLRRYLRKLIYPVEAYRLWDHACPGFSEPDRDLLKEDVTPGSRQAVRRLMAQMLTTKRRRLVGKITGWPRIGFLKEIFPDARFIHIYRDGRAVANSFLAVSWWSGWRGPGAWSWGELSPEQSEKWERHNRSYVALAAIQWEILMSAQREAKLRLSPNSLFEVRYEDLCQDPVGTIRLVTEFCALDWAPLYEAAVQDSSFESTNHKWQEQLGAEQRRILNDCLGSTLKEWGYA